MDLRKYSPWFYAAAAYNLVWGAANILFPNLLFDLIGMPRPSNPALWQVVGMFVLVYAPAYWWAARNPAAHRHLVVIALLGKLLGPLGFVWALASEQLPAAFFFVILTNDLIWWPAFFGFLRAAAAQHGGWRTLLNGE
jgi:small multidrug resistance pump